MLGGCTGYYYTAKQLLYFHISQSMLHPQVIIPTWVSLTTRHSLCLQSMCVLLINLISYNNTVSRRLEWCVVFLPTLQKQFGQINHFISIMHFKNVLSSSASSVTTSQIVYLTQLMIYLNQAYDIVYLVYDLYIKKKKSFWDRWHPILCFSLVC